jgi:hypothetical protein
MAKCTSALYPIVSSFKRTPRGAKCSQVMNSTKVKVAFGLQISEACSKPLKLALLVLFCVLCNENAKTMAIHYWLDGDLFVKGWVASRNTARLESVTSHYPDTSMEFRSTVATRLCTTISSPLAGPASIFSLHSRGFLRFGSSRLGGRGVHFLQSLPCILIC